MPELEQQALFDYLPHRPPMLLLSRVVSVGDKSANAVVNIDSNSSFFQPGKGVPAWIGIEYMGQTAALIAGYQKMHRQLAPHLGFLLGTRRYKTASPWFTIGSCLQISCEQLAVVGESLANFACSIRCDEQTIATANLSVFRKPLNDKSNALK